MLVNTPTEFRTAGNIIIAPIKTEYLILDKVIWTERDTLPEGVKPGVIIITGMSGEGKSFAFRKELDKLRNLDDSNISFLGFGENITVYNRKTDREEILTGAPPTVANLTAMLADTSKSEIVIDSLTSVYGMSFSVAATEGGFEPTIAYLLYELNHMAYMFNKRIIIVYNTIQTKIDKSARARLNQATRGLINVRKRVVTATDPIDRSKSRTFSNQLLLPFLFPHNYPNQDFDFGPVQDTEKSLSFAL